MSNTLTGYIALFIEDTGNLPTADEYLEMCRKALENPAP